MYFGQLLQPNGQSPLGGALSGGGGIGSLASLIALGAGGGGGAGGSNAPVLPQPGMVPQSGPAGSPIPPVQPPQQSNILQTLMQMDPQRLRQMLMGMGLGQATNPLVNASPGLVNALLSSPDFSQFFRGEGGAY